ncbi:MAG: hypothetical protein K8R90_09400 [Candidatus Cloacimonetes bacterium]|nr:hypothetical protein [Candidatus Cloacimonadota bacterium]
MEHLQIRITAETKEARRNLDSLGKTLETTGASLAEAAKQAKATQEAMQSVGAGAFGANAEGSQTATFEAELARRGELEQQAVERRRQTEADYIAWRQQQWSAQHQRETNLAHSAMQSVEGFYRRAIGAIIDRQMSWRRANQMVAASLRDLASDMLAALVKSLVQAAVQAVASAFIIEKAMRKPALLTSLATAGVNAVGAIAGIKAAQSALVAAETGFDNVVSRPTLFLAGEGFQPEHVQVTPLRGANLHGPAAEGGLATRLDRLIGQVRALQLELVRSQPIVQVVNHAPDIQSQVQRLDWARNRMNDGGYDGSGEDLAL